MSTETENKEVSNEVVETKKEKKKSVIVKEIISAIIGAAISFAATFGLITSDQEAEVRSRMANINTTATEVVEVLKKGDIVTAIAKVNKIVEDTNAVKEIAESGIKKAKEKSEETKKIVEKTKEEIKEATKK